MKTNIFLFELPLYAAALFAAGRVSILTNYNTVLRAECSAGQTFLPRHALEALSSTPWLVALGVAFALSLLLPRRVLNLGNEPRSLLRVLLMVLVLLVVFDHGFYSTLDNGRKIWEYVGLVTPCALFGLELFPRSWPRTE